MVQLLRLESCSFYMVRRCDAMVGVEHMALGAIVVVDIFVSC